MVSVSPSRKPMKLQHNDRRSHMQRMQRLIQRGGSTHLVTSARKLKAWIRGPTVPLEEASAARGSLPVLPAASACRASLLRQGSNQHKHAVGFICSTCMKPGADSELSALDVHGNRAQGDARACRLPREPRMAPSQHRNMTNGTPTPACPQMSSCACHAWARLAQRQTRPSTRLL